MSEPTDNITRNRVAIDRSLKAATDALQRGDFAQSSRLIEQLLAEHPDSADAHRAMAQLAMQSGRQPLALQHMAQACRLAPERGDLHFQLACLQAHLGQLEAALEHFRIATERLPTMADAWRLLGTTLSRLHRNREALPALRRAHDLAPGNKTLEALAEAQFHGGWPADALVLWQTLLEHDPDDLHARLRTGETLSRLGFQGDAVALYREGVRHLPDSDALWLALAQAEEDNGQRDAARVAYERALALHPDWPFALSSLLGMLRSQAPDPLVEQTTTLLERPGLSDDDRALLGYALGKVHDGLGQYDHAMKRWHDANAARQRVAGQANPNALQQRVDRLIDAFSSDMFSRQTDSGNAAPLPASERFVFIVGMPRSGTTLTEQIIASHPQAFGCGELPDLAMVADTLSMDGKSDARRPDVQALLAPGALHEAIDRYTAAITRHAPNDALRLVDKEPLNFFHLGLVALMFPKARVVWCRRDPRDIAVSIYGENFALDETLATDLAGIGHYINAQQRLMRHWQAVLPLPILELHYEQLVTHTEAQARHLLEYVGLPWDPACLQFHRNTQAVQTPSRWQVRQPVHARSIGRWRNYEADLAPLFQVLDNQQ